VSERTTKQQSRMENMAPRLQTLTHTNGPGTTLLLRLAVGAVFLSEGIQKFLFPERLAEGRFEKIGIPAPEIFGPLAATAETVCGILLLLGLCTRLAAIPLVILMSLALTLTKVPILWGGSSDKPGAEGWWDMAHQSRTDWAMLLILIYLFITGAGQWSLDTMLHRRFVGSADPTPFSHFSHFRPQHGDPTSKNSQEQTQE